MAGSMAGVCVRADRFHSLTQICTHQTTVEEEEQRRHGHEQAQERLLTQFMKKVKERVRQRERCKGALLQDDLQSFLNDDGRRVSAASVGRQCIQSPSCNDGVFVVSPAVGRLTACKQLATYCHRNQAYCGNVQEEDKEEEEEEELGDYSMMACNTGSDVCVCGSDQHQIHSSSTACGMEMAHTSNVFNPYMLTELHRHKRSEVVSSVHCLYSDRDRQQCRQWLEDRQHQHETNMRRQQREGERTLLEQEEAVCEEDGEHQLKVTGTIHQQQQLRRAQHATELKRYCEALYQQLKVQRYHHSVVIPSLCSCHSSLWMCCPLSCAANCVYHDNHAAYHRVLHCLLQSLNT